MDRPPARPADLRLGEKYYPVSNYSYPHRLGSRLDPGAPPHQQQHYQHHHFRHFRHHHHQQQQQHGYRQGYEGDEHRTSTSTASHSSVLDMMVDDQGSDASVEEDEYHSTGSVLWDSFWQSQEDREDDTIHETQTLKPKPERYPALLSSPTSINAKSTLSGGPHHHHQYHHRHAEPHQLTDDQQQQPGPRAPPNQSALRSAAAATGYDMMHHHNATMGMWPTAEDTFAFAARRPSTGHSSTSSRSVSPTCQKTSRRQLQQQQQRQRQPPPAPPKPATWSLFPQPDPRDRRPATATAAATPREVATRGAGRPSVTEALALPPRKSSLAALADLEALGQVSPQREHQSIFHRQHHHQHTQHTQQVRTESLDSGDSRMMEAGLAKGKKHRPSPLVLDAAGYVKADAIGSSVHQSFSSTSSTFSAASATSSVYSTATYSTAASAFTDPVAWNTQEQQHQETAAVAASPPKLAPSAGTSPVVPFPAYCSPVVAAPASPPPQRPPRPDLGPASAPEPRSTATATATSTASGSGSNAPTAVDHTRCPSVPIGQQQHALGSASYKLASLSTPSLSSSLGGYQSPPSSSFTDAFPPPSLPPQWYEYQQHHLQQQQHQKQQQQHAARSPLLPCVSVFELDSESDEGGAGGGAGSGDEDGYKEEASRSLARRIVRGLALGGHHHNHGHAHRRDRSEGHGGRRRGRSNASSYNTGGLGSGNLPVLSHKRSISNVEGRSSSGSSSSSNGHGSSGEKATVRRARAETAGAVPGPSRAGVRGGAERAWTPNGAGPRRVGVEGSGAEGDRGLESSLSSLSSSSSTGQARPRLKRQKSEVFGRMLGRQTKGSR